MAKKTAAKAQPKPRKAKRVKKPVSILLGNGDFVLGSPMPDPDGVPKITIYKAKGRLAVGVPVTMAECGDPVVEIEITTLAALASASAMVNRLLTLPYWEQINRAEAFMEGARYGINVVNDFIFENEIKRG